MRALFGAAPRAAYMYAPRATRGGPRAWGWSASLYCHRSLLSVTHARTATPAAVGAPGFAACSLSSPVVVVSMGSPSAPQKSSRRFVLAKGTAGTVAFVLLSSLSRAAARNNLSRTPPMGWMSWEIFRCKVDCMADSANCISEKLYHQQADALVSKGFLSAGYNGIHLDGCWEKQCTTKTCTKSLDGRDPATGALLGSPERFPSGMRNLGEYFHNRSIKYALYTSESKNICGCPYAGSESNEQLDADTFAGWGVE